MIKVESFHDPLISEVDCELEDFLKDHEIRRQDIILLKPYAEKGEDGILYHYVKLVYESFSTDELIGGVQEI